MDNLSIPYHFVKASLRGAEYRGVDPNQLLRLADIDPELLGNPGVRISGRQYTRLIQTIWHELQDEYMGYGTHKSKPGTFATMALLTIHCHTLETVFRRGHMFYNLFDCPIALKLDQSEGQAQLTLDVSGIEYDPDHFFRESILVIWHRYASWLIGDHIIMDEAFFDYSAPPHVDEYKQIFFCPCKFDQTRTGFIFNDRYLQSTIIQDESTLQGFLKSSPADMLSRPDDSNSYRAKIRKAIGRDLSDELPDFETIASQVFLSPQTLRRRLKEENTSYQEIKDNLRRDQAIYHLSRNEYSINDIAHLVGFTEPSTFHRAFKKWTGITPGAYRLGERSDES